MSRQIRPIFCAVALLLASTASIGCATHYLPNTDVEDTGDNRKIIAFAEKYRRSVERGDITTLIKYASPAYYEDGGNVDASDDIDYAGLREYLTTRFRDARSIRYEIRYRRVTFGSDGRIFVDYTYSASYKIPGEGSQEVWRRKVDDNRLELIPNNDDYLIVAGM